MKLKTTYRLILPFLLVSSFLNFALALFVFFRIRKPASYNVVLHESPSFPEPPSFTNDNFRASALPPSYSSSRVESSLPQIPAAPLQSPEVHRYNYHYFVASGLRVAYLNGSYIREGDLHAFGVVSRIFPERIYFVDGSYIENFFGVSKNDYTGIGADGERVLVPSRSDN